MFFLGPLVGLVGAGLQAYQEHRKERAQRRQRRREQRVFAAEEAAAGMGAPPGFTPPFVPSGIGRPLPPFGGAGDPGRVIGRGGLGRGFLPGPGSPPELTDAVLQGLGVGPILQGVGALASPASLVGIGRGVVGPVVRAGRAAWAAAKIAAAKARGRIPRLSKRALIELGATAVGIGLWAVDGEVVQESRRRMNPLNPRALGRAQRRVCAFARFATQSYAIRGLVRRRRRSACAGPRKKCR